MTDAQRRANQKQNALRKKRGAIWLDPEDVGMLDLLRGHETRAEYVRKMLTKAFLRAYPSRS